LFRSNPVQSIACVRFSVGSTAVCRRAQQARQTAKRESRMRGALHPRTYRRGIGTTGPKVKDRRWGAAVLTVPRVCRHTSSCDERQRTTGQPSLACSVARGHPRQPGRAVEPGYRVATLLAAVCGTVRACRYSAAARCAPPNAPDAKAWATCASSSFRTLRSISSVCSPSSGDRFTSEMLSDILIGLPTDR
jgi:hypothetical protein